MDTTKSKKVVWGGRILSILCGLFMLLDGVMKLVQPEPVMKATARLGLPASALVGIGIVLIACTLLYLIRRTAMLGAILLTGYLGGAVAIQLRAGSPPFEMLFPIIFAVLLWGGLYLQGRCPLLP